MAVYMQSERNNFEDAVGGARCRKVELAGRDVLYLFLSPDMVFYPFLLKEALERPMKFLTPAETAHFVKFTVEKRKIDWLGGRLAAKLLLSRFMGSKYSFLNFEVLPDEDGHPTVTVRLNESMKIELGRSLSISHRDGAAAAAVSADTVSSVGFDIEVMERRSKLMLDDYFESPEVDLLAGLPGDISPYMVAVGWSIKESVLKASLLGLSIPLQSVIIEKMDMDTGYAEVAIRDNGHSGRFVVKTIYQPPYILSVARAL